MGWSALQPSSQPGQAARLCGYVNADLYVSIQWSIMSYDHKVLPISRHHCPFALIVHLSSTTPQNGCCLVKCSGFVFHNFVQFLHDAKFCRGEIVGSGLVALSLDNPLAGGRLPADINPNSNPPQLDIQFK